MLHYTNESSNSSTSSYKPTATVLKAFRVLEFISSNQPVKPAQITKKLGLSRTNVHRLLSTLMYVGYVTKDEKRGYRLTFRMFKLGSRVPLSQDLREIAKPVMTDLMVQANENTYLTVLYGHTVVAMEEVKSNNPLSLNPDVTYSYPIYACASGKNFLAYMEPGERNNLLAELTFEKRTPKTITDLKELFAELDRIRHRGYAMELQEFSNDLNSYAAPIFDYRGKMVANIGISGPSIRATEDRLNRLVEPLLAAAESISQQLGRMND